jgi:uncharacterized membrane protein (GlpM family)
MSYHDVTKKRTSMVTLALAARDIVRSAYNFRAATDHQQKVEEMEAIIFGVTKVCGIFCTFSSLYAAYFFVERLDLQVILAGLTVCIHPVAALDIIGSAAGVYGIIKIGKGVLLHTENRKPLAQWTKLAREQVKREGYQFYAIRSFKGPEGPPETIERLKELLRELRDKHFKSNSWDEWVASVNKAWEYSISGLHLLGISALSGIGIVGLDEVTKGTKPFWLDRKMVDFSKWLAPQIA